MLFVTPHAPTRMNSVPSCLSGPGSGERILIVRLSKPRNSAEPPIAAIILGYGMADLVAASRFVKHGWLAMQVRLISQSSHHADLLRRYDTYDESGVSRCREAMDYVERTHGVRRFVLMGNCALANICFKSAMSDARVVGLTLINPYIPENFAGWFSVRIRRHLFNMHSWLRLLRGGMQIQRRMEPDEVRLNNFTGDVALAADFALGLQRLVLQRAVRVLVAFSRPDARRFYSCKQYGKPLRELARRGQIRCDVLPIDGHDFSATEQGAQKLTGLISDWLKSNWTGSEPLRRPTAAGVRSWVSGVCESSFRLPDMRRRLSSWIGS